ncbi:MAG: PD-(D/E)XK nuclease family protein, partial [Coriobacteriaceae bacterium]|nr:PD-(D/E)XK nuclease family protein [Coriobacteriaceae bacterium]
DAEPAYPAVVLDELADCYRSNLSSYEGVDKRTALPDSLLAYAAFSGEDRLYENLFAQGACPQQGTVEHLLETGAVSDAAREMIVLPALPKEGAPAQEVAQPVFSPSAIESYLECPYKWFSLRRLRLEGLDGGFGALEKGSFSHNVLKLFYEEFQREGFEKVSAENIETARGLLVKLFDERLEAQSTLKRNENPLIALSELEKAEIDVLKRQLLAYLAREATFLSGFTPRYFETSFGRSESFVYAAQRFCGSIDRIDVNDKGQAVVIDYKTSLSKDYALAQGSDLVWLAAAADGERVAGENDGTDGADGTSDNDEGDGTRGTPKSLLLPHKIQALIYAQAARKLLGLDVVGALYVSLGASGTIAGAIDSLVLGPADISGIEVKTCSVQEVGASNFGALLDAVEEMIAPALACLLEGHIAPDPRGSDPCGFCPVSACGLRV